MILSKNINRVQYFVHYTLTLGLIWTMLQNSLLPYWKWKTKPKENQIFPLFFYFSINKRHKERRYNINVHCYLDNTAAVRMCRKCGNLTFKRRNDKTNFFWRNTFYTLLYNMIPILITHASHNMTIKFTHKMCLLIPLNNFKCLRKNQAYMKYFGNWIITINSPYNNEKLW